MTGMIAPHERSNTSGQNAVRTSHPVNHGIVNTLTSV